MPDIDSLLVNAVKSLKTETQVEKFTRESQLETKRIELTYASKAMQEIIKKSIESKEFLLEFADLTLNNIEAGKYDNLSGEISALYTEKLKYAESPEQILAIKLLCVYKSKNLVLNVNQETTQVFITDPSKSKVLSSPK